MSNDHNNDKHVYTLIVNGRPKPYESKKAGFRDVVPLAYDVPDYDKYLYDVTFFRGEGGHEGDLLETDKPISVQNEMVFNVRRSDKS